MPIIKLGKKELAPIIENIERNGGDASQLRAIFESDPGKHRSGDTISEIADDDYVEMLLQKSPVEEGTDLECIVCHSQVPTLISGVCRECFRPWALSTKRS